MNRININDLNYIITECINLLVENTSVSAAYRKYFNNIPEDTYKELVELDPTYKGGDIMGKYGVWILNQYKKGNINDTNSLRTYLETFTKFINRIDNKNIQSYKNPEELKNTIQPFLDDPNQATSKTKEKMKVKRGAKNVYEDSDWVVIVPKTWEASKFYGANTKWCTAERDDNYYFNYYSEMSPLYILINKKTNDKYQLHMPDTHNWQFKNDEDNEVIKPCYSIKLSDGIIDFFDNLTNNTFSSTYLKDEMRQFIINDSHKKLYFVINKYGSFIDIEGKLKKFDDNIKRIFPFINGYAKIQRENDNFNIIDINGNLISDKWWLRIGDFSCGFFMVYNGDKYNYIDSNGNLISDVWWDYAFDFFNDFGIVSVENNDNDEFNIINKKGELISDKWWLDIMPFYEGFFRIINKDNKYNFMDDNGRLISDKWWCKAYDFHNGLAVVCDEYNFSGSPKNRYGYIDRNGNHMFGKWWCLASPFRDNIAMVRNDKWDFTVIDKEGNYIFNDWWKEGDFYGDDIVVASDGKGSVYKLYADGKMERIK